ncbi:hypothetical protein G7054_g6170 [Neopestalotiopsis clavispora]|nr:hypothetical protein G7054_g6170 [Neopestalotiopsis clavispora]
MYTHQPISRENAEIRLVKFTSDNRNNENQRISLELQPASLKDESVRYAALSYVWGDTETELMEVEINGFPFLVMQNLYKGLKSLLRIIGGNDPPWLWADAICIDQSNQIERTWQVAQMHDIYTRADPVYMLLGSGSKKIYRAMDFIASVGPRFVASGILEKSVWPSEEEVKEFVDFDLGFLQLVYELIIDERLYPSTTEGKIILAGILELLRKDYWHRIWIIQEVTLAKTAILTCGDQSVSLDHFEGIVYATRYCRSMIDRCRDRGLGETRAKWKGFTWTMGGTESRMLPLAIRRQNGKEPIQLVNILLQASMPPHRPWYSASDSRDLVFALLGIVSDSNRLGLSVDYSRTTAEVFISLTRAFLGEERRCWSYDLDRCVPRSDQGYLPSWVPDWADVGRNGLKTYPINLNSNFSATRGIGTPKDGDDPRSPVLRRHGCYVDVITEVMQPPKLIQSNKYIPSGIKDINGWLNSIIEFTKLGPESGPGEDYIWRTVMKGRHNDKQRTYWYKNPSIKNDILRFLREVMRQHHINADSLTAEVAQYVCEGILYFQDYSPQSKSLETRLSYIMHAWPRSIAMSGRGRTLFKTTKDMLGLGHVAIQPGDHVTLLWGQAAPIILRPRNGHDASDGFRFLGDAYVDGIMYGEYLKNDPEHVVFDMM